MDSWRLLFFFTPCHCSWQESAQPGRRLSWAENRKELRKRERGGGERKNTAALFWLVFQDTRLETPQPATCWVSRLPLCRASTSGGAIFMPSSAGTERPSPAQLCPSPRSASPLPTSSILGYVQPRTVCSEMENASSEAKRAPCLLAGSLAPFLPSDGLVGGCPIWKERELPCCCGRKNSSAQRSDTSTAQESVLVLTA